MCRHDGTIVLDRRHMIEDDLKPGDMIKFDDSLMYISYYRELPHGDSWHEFNRKYTKHFHDLDGCWLIMGASDVTLNNMFDVKDERRIIHVVSPDAAVVYILDCEEMRMNMQVVND